MGTVNLYDGRAVDSASEEWRAECEARTVLTWPVDRREGYFDKVEAKRGKEAAMALRNAVMEIWVDRKARELLALERQDLLAVDFKLQAIQGNTARGLRIREMVERKMQELRVV